MSPNLTYGIAYEPSSPPHSFLEETVTPDRIPKPHNNPLNPVPNVPAYPDSDPSSSNFILSESSESSGDEYYK